MKRLLLSTLFLLFAGSAFSQLVFDLGLKAGVNVSNLKIEEGSFLSNEGINLNSDAITKMHWGAFGRIGYDRVYLQPEVYYSKKGGNLSSNIFDLTSDFDYSNVDVPLLLGYRMIKGKAFDFKIMAGPVFSFVTNADYPDELDPYLKDEFFNEHLVGLQYGLGLDVLFITLDARVEHAGKFYDDPAFASGNATTFMFSVGFKIL
uniref:outer membrane beta-barrel protein n=1 Tax=uncultured Draconibacterium sp. TaxID=1573823 RepID=UPI0032173C77